MNRLRPKPNNAHVTASGGFVIARLSRRKHVTLAVEGRDQDGPSVAGVALDSDQLDKLIRRLTNLRENLERYQKQAET